MSLLKSISFFKRSPKSKNNNNTNNDNGDNEQQNDQFHLDQNSDDTINSVSTPSSPNPYNTKESQIILNNYPPNYMQSTLQSQYASDPNFSQYQRHHKHQRTNTNNNKRRTVSNADFYYENKKRNNKNKKHKRKSSKSPRKRKRKGTQIEDATNYYYNGVDDNDENDIHNSQLQIFNHIKSDTMVIRPTVSVPDYRPSDDDEDEEVIGHTQSLPLSPNQWHIHRPITPNSTPNGRLYLVPSHPIHTNNSSSNYSNYSHYSDYSGSHNQPQNGPHPQRPKLQLNHSIPLRPEEKQLIIRTNHLNGMKAAEEEFQNLTHIIIQQLPTHHQPANSNVYDCTYLLCL